MSDEFDMDDIVDAPATAGPSRETFAEDSALPLKHFKLSAHPFADSVNPEYFFRTESHEEAFLQMKQCIEDHISLGLTTAISGTGKTMLTQVLMQELDPRRYQPILVLAYPGMSRTALLREILAELKLEVEVPERANMHKLVTLVQEHIIQQYMNGVRLVLIIDEVHFLTAEALHILRTLSNIEVPENKLVTVLLFGEQCFLQKMKHPSFRSIFSRMFTRAEIRPLDPAEVAQYAKFRLMMAGGRPELIDRDCIETLYKISGGLPREINRICHNALAIAAREGRPCVDASILKRIPAALPVDRG